MPEHRQERHERHERQNEQKAVTETARTRVEHRQDMKELSDEKESYADATYERKCNVISRLGVKPGCRARR